MVTDETLPQALRDGLGILRDRHYAEAHVAAVDANFALIDVGEMPPPDAYVETTVRVYARLPLDIRNAEPYGVVTVPPLHRRDGQPIGHQHIGHANATAIVNAGAAEAAFWSWNWNGLRRGGPEDVALAYEWAWKCLRDGAR